jgi:hypothetical protein
MKRDRYFISLIVLSMIAIGCGDGAAAGSGGTGGDGGSPGAGGSGAVGGEGGDRGDPGSPALDPLQTMPRYAVLSTDFSSSSIAMLDETFEVIDDSWLNSGTTYPGLVATLSGDVVLPTRQAGDSTFAVVDRFFTDVVTRFFVPSGNLNGQVRTQGEVGDSGFSSNPQDVIFVGAQSAWVPRYESNLNPAAAPENQGNDLFEINPTNMLATGRRIDLSSLNVTAMAGENEVEVFARPSRGVLIGSTIAIGLDRISAAFDAAGTGMVGLVNFENETVDGLELPGLKSCGNAVPVPGAPTKIAVACVGFAQPFGDEPQVRASTGIAIIDVTDGIGTIERVWRVADDPDSAIAVNFVVALDEKRVLGVASGDFGSRPDVLHLIDLETGAQSVVHESAGSFVLGVSAYDPDREMLYVPDASANAVVELAVEQTGFTELRRVQIAPWLGLPPNQVHLLE